MAVQPSQFEVLRQRQHAFDCLRRSSGGKGEPKLLILVCRGDELVGVGLDAESDPDQHLGASTCPLRQKAEASDLFVRVNHDVANSCFERERQLELGLVVPVHQQVAARDTCSQRAGKLTRSAHIDSQALLGDPASEFGGQERLGCVVDQRRHRWIVKRLSIARHPGPHVGLVHRKDRRSKLRHEIPYVAATDHDRTGLWVAMCRLGPNSRLKFKGVFSGVGLLWTSCSV